VTVKVPPEELDVLLGHPSIQRAKYVGRFGWVTVAIEDGDTLRLALDLIDDSYELIAGAGGAVATASSSDGASRLRRPAARQTRLGLDAERAKCEKRLRPIAVNPAS